MTQALEALVGTQALSDFRLDALVHINDALATYVATCTLDGSACTVRIAQRLEVGEHQEASIRAAITRVGRHAVGIRGIAPPRTAGVVVVDGQRRLAIAHAGDPRPSAEDRIVSGQKSSLEQVLALIDPIAEALGALHDQGIVHGAIHPGAVRLDPAATTLSAFGLSELAAVIGGPAAARDAVPVRSRTPEQVGIVPASPSPESDTYAIAMLAVELLAGEPFTQETNPREIAAAIDHPVARPTPRSLGIDVTDAVESVFVNALRPGPRQRTSDPREFVRRLSESRWQAEQGAQAPQPDVEPPPSPQAMPSGAGFEPPPRPVEKPAAPPKHAYPPLPPDPSKEKSNLWVVYLLVGLGALLLLGGVGAGFYFAINRPPIAATTATTAPPVVTPPPPLTPPPPPTTKPHLGDPDALADPDAGEENADAGPKSHPWTATDAGPAIYPNDIHALVPIGTDTAVVGSRDALVTIVLFADMQCPHTRRARSAVERLLDTYGSELRVAVRHLPMSDHAGAELSAEAAAGAFALGGPTAFWHLFEKMTVNPSTQTRENLLDWASQIGVSRSLLGSALDAHTHRSVVEADVRVAGQLMVRATPTFFVNGRRLNGMQSQAELTNIVENERIASRAALGSGTPPDTLYTTRVRFNVTSAAADRRRP